MLIFTLGAFANWPGKLRQLPWHLSRYVPGAGLLLLAACTSSPVAEEAKVATSAAPVSLAAPVKLGYFYQGALAGKLAVHFYLLPDGHAQLYGQYRYAGRKEAIGLTGRRQAHGQLVLREYTNSDQPEKATAEFRLALQADGSLTGTWQTLPPARPRHLAVVLRPEAPPAPGCQAPVITGLNTSLPIITVADTAATQALRAELGQLMADVPGDAGTEALYVDYADNCLLSLNVTGEMQGASITQGNRRYVLDLRTGQQFMLESELLPSRKAAFQAEANRRLHQAIEDYIRQQATDGDTLAADDVAGLRQQQLEVRPGMEPSPYLAEGEVRFPILVSYDMLSSFMAKMYHDQFAAAFSFAEIQPYLVPGSPLRRLATLPPARPAK